MQLNQWAKNKFHLLMLQLIESYLIFDIYAKSYAIGHINNILTMQFFTGISRYTQSKSYAIIDWVHLGFPNYMQCNVEYPSTCPIGYVKEYPKIRYLGMIRSNKNFTDFSWEFHSVAFSSGNMPYSIILQNSKLTGCLPLWEVYPCTACTDRHQIHNIPRSSYNHCDTRSHRELGVDACQMDPQILHAESADRKIFFL